MSKEKVQVAAQIYPVNGVINVDYRYGPYDSIAEAVQTLGADNLDCIKAGLKFGVKESDGTVTDYVFLEDNGGADKVQKVLHIDEATTEKAGLMSAQDKSALAAVQAKANQNAQDIEGLGDDISDANASIQQNASAIQQNASDIGSINASITQILAAQTELRTAVNGLTGIDNTNYKGIFPNVEALPDMDRSGWALVGSSLSSLLLYTYTDVNTVWTLYSNDTYDFTDFSGLVSQVAAIGSNLGDLSQLETEDKSDLVSAINEVKNNASSTAQDTSYVDNQGLGSTNVQGALDSAGNRLGELSDFCSDTGFFTKDIFELGNIVFRNTGFTYGNSTSRVRTKQGESLHLRKGDVISLADYTDAQFYVGWQLNGNYYFYNGWRTTDYTVSVEADYSVLLRNLTEVTQTSKDALASLLRISSVNSNENLSERIEEVKESGYEEFTWDTIPIERGKINISDSAFVYDDTYTKRVRTAKGFVLPLKKGDVISLADYTGVRFYLGWKNSEDVYTGLDWRSSDYTVAEDGDYYVVIGNNPEVVISDISALASLLRVRTSQPSTLLAESVRYKTTVPNGNILEQPSQIRCRNGIKILAHRGFHQHGIPENSIDAYRYAGLFGYDYAETDFCGTSDGELVLMHDATINRTMYNAADYTPIEDTITVSEHTLEDLQSNYVLIASDPRMRRPIPTLRDFFVTCRDSGVFPIAEIKETGITNAQVLQAFELGKSILGEGNFGFCSFSYGKLDYVRSLSEKTLLLYIGTTFLNTNNTVTGDARETPYTMWDPQYKNYGLDKAKTEAIKAKGSGVGAWTVPISSFDTMMKYGVQIFTTDEVAPNIDGLTGRVFKTDSGFSEFVYTGTVVDGVMSLQPSQYIQTPLVSSSIRTGGYYVSVMGKGKFKIESNNLSVTVTSESEDRFIYQGLILNGKPSLKVTASEASEISFIEYKFSKF